MKEIGGYLEFENNYGYEYYPQALAVNCGRSAAVLIAKLRDYKKVFFPDYMCSSVKNALIKNGVDIELYSVDNSLNPVFDKVLSENEAIYIVNYYGQFRERIAEFSCKWKNMILDNAQDFFFKSDSVDCVYTCRKYFGVSDGGYATLHSKCNTDYYDDLNCDYSYERMRFILGRYEKNASEFYNESVNNNSIFESDPVSKMSKLTRNILRAIDYDRIKEIRRNNFSTLHAKLADMNELKSIKIIDGAFMYPFRIKNGAVLRKELQQQKIYVPKLWPDIPDSAIAKCLAEEIVPLPCDQRYNNDDMNYIVDQIYKIIG